MAAERAQRGRKERGVQHKEGRSLRPISWKLRHGRFGFCVMCLNNIWVRERGEEEHTQKKCMSP